MNNQQEIIEGKPVSDDAKHILAIFNEMEGKQLEFLDQAAKSLIDRIAALLAVLFAVTAFGDTFPPAYLKDNQPAKVLAIFTVVCYVIGMIVSMLAIQPRYFPRYRNNITAMQRELEKLVDHKMGRLQIAGLLFWVGSISLSFLIGAIILVI